jgi:hypothetical protein
VVVENDVERKRRQLKQASAVCGGHEQWLQPTVVVETVVAVEADAAVMAVAALIGNGSVVVTIAKIAATIGSTIDRE